MQLNIMTRSRTILPAHAADRYDADSCPSDDFVNVFGGESDHADHTGDAWTTSDGTSSQQRPSIHEAAKHLLEHLSDGNEEFLDVDGVAKFLRIPRTAAHCILDVLDVFQVRTLVQDTLMLSFNSCGTSYFFVGYHSTWIHVHMEGDNSCSTAAAVRQVQKCGHNIL